MKNQSRISQKMTPQEQKELQLHLNRIAEILYCNTPAEKLLDFETIENTVRSCLKSSEVG